MFLKPFLAATLVLGALPFGARAAVIPTKAPRAQTIADRRDRDRDEGDRERRRARRRHETPRGPEQALRRIEEQLDRLERARRTLLERLERFRDRAPRRFEFDFDRRRRAPKGRRPRFDRERRHPAPPRERAPRRRFERDRRAPTLLFGWQTARARVLFRLEPQAGRLTIERSGPEGTSTFSVPLPRARSVFPRWCGADERPRRRHRDRRPHERRHRHDAPWHWR